MGEQFVTGQTISEAIANSRRLEAQGFRYSYDMLGEAATTGADAHAVFPLAGGELAGRFRPDAVASGSAVRLALDLRKLSLFDQDTGRRL